MIGLGLDNKEITQKGLDALKQVDKAYAEFYTNTANINLEDLPADIEILGREDVEQEDKILESAEERETAFLVSGDPLTATTHYDIKHRAEQKNIEVKIIHAPSIFTSIAETGLNVYKFGRTVTLPREGKPSSIKKYIENNDSIGLHSLILLDIDYDGSEAANKLVEIGIDRDREAILIERANHEDMNITVSTLGQISGTDLGRPPHSIILSGDKSFKEEEFTEAL